MRLRTPAPHPSATMKDWTLWHRDGRRVRVFVQHWRESWDGPGLERRKARTPW